METNYEKIIENIIRGLVNEACLNSETYNEAKLYIDMNISNTELGLMIKKIAHDKIEKTKIQVEKLEECLSQLANFEFDVLTE